MLASRLVHFAGILMLVLAFCVVDVAAEDSTQILIVVGPSNHPPGTHEVAAGARLLADCLARASNMEMLSCEVHEGWPSGQPILTQADCVVFSGDRFPLAEMEDTEKNMRELGMMMERGCGIVCFHYATGLTRGQMPDDGSHPLLDWMGGYFATRCAHHQSIAKIFESADIMLDSPEHPVLNGVQPFTVHDEPYINNYFGPEGMQPNVVPLLSSMLPPESPKREVVAWATQRRDGGRGMAIVMPHFYKNWLVDDLRKVIVNGIVWAAKRDIPGEGVLTPAPDLAVYQPESVEFQPRRR